MSTINPADHLGLVGEIAKKYRKCGLPYEDLKQEGALGLLRAVERFDPSLGYAFSTYAQHWIRAFIQKALARSVRTIKLPYRKYYEGVKAGSLPAQPLSLDAPMLRRDRTLTTTLHHVVPANVVMPDVAAAIDEERAAVQQFVRRLPESQQEVLRMRFEEDLTLEEIGECLGISRQRVQQIESKAFRYLKPKLSRRLGRAA